jgi:sortase A
VITRVLGGIGRVMIAAGVLILLFVVYQLWGTGLRTAAAQNQLQDEFRARQEQAQAQASATTLPAIDGTEVTTTTAPGTPPPTIAPPTPGGDLPPAKPGEPLGNISIDEIGVDFQMVEGVDLNYLQKGPGHFPSTPFPGQAGNAALAGHRTTWAAPFNRIDELQPGDPITVVTVQGTFTYRVLPQPGANEGEVIGHKIIRPTQTEILDQPAEGGANTLTLMACHPKYSAAERIVVVAELVGNPAPTTEKSEESKAASATGSTELLASGEGLAGGDPDARTTAILWSLVAAAIWLVTWLIARRWSWRQVPKWLTYVAGFVVFSVPLFLAFEAINKLLPAGY